MNILLISQCDKRALVETRRILDQFAERRGDRTWQTPITQDGLDTLRRLLRKTARRNTAVACHWIRGLDHSELLWTVGDASRFNAQGAVPTETTFRNVLRANDENDWHTGEDIHLLTALAALLHDLGKASEAFQARLAGRLTERNQYRHEWVSLRLFEAFVGTDDDATWLKRLIAPTPEDDATWTRRLRRDGVDSGALPTPFAALKHAPLAQAVGWLVVTHHRLPVLPAHDEHGQQRFAGCPSGRFGAESLCDALLHMQADWSEVVAGAPAEQVRPYWTFDPHVLPVTLPHWRTQARRLATRLLALVQRPDRRAGFAWLDEPWVMHLSRMALMLADHHYSSLSVQGSDERQADGRLSVPAGCTLLANTRKDLRGRTVGNQTLDEHLLGVAADSRAITHALPSLRRSLPDLGRPRLLRQRSADERFRWQDKAADLATEQRVPAEQHGAFIVNMASTGCGKTLANARIMDALAEPERGMRCVFAMGLRTLTLQTGRAFQQRLQLKDEQLAIRVGGSASRALFDHFEQRAEATGSASQQALLLEPEEEGSVEFGGDAAIDTHHPLLARALHDPKVTSLLVAPILVCTIDHLVPVTDSLRGGRQIAPMLRLLTSDLVIDEPDDFDLADLPALTRLVHWAGLLGSRVLLSSATLTPSLVQGLFMAYRAGRTAFQRHRGAEPGRAGVPPEVVCLWVDEFQRQATTCPTLDHFRQAHEQFTAQRSGKLAEQAATQARRRCALIDVRDLQQVGRDEERYAALALLLRRHAVELHTLHAVPDPRYPQRRVSFGLIRMANIEPLVQVALKLFETGVQEGHLIHLCVYHSQFPLLVRSNIEQRLDAALDRRRPNAVFDLPDIRARLDAHPQALQQMFIVLGSPVTEVGRDHDYDWAIVEPSSMRSLIQLVGRVRRHREGACSTPNVRVWNTNLRYFSRRPGEPVYCKPGFEDKTALLEHHLLPQLLRREEFGVVDARPRIRQPEPLESAQRWVDLEHHRLQRALLPPRAGSAAYQGLPTGEAAWWWWDRPARDVLMTALLPQHQPFRADHRQQIDLCLRPSDDDPDRIELTEVIDQKTGHPDYPPIQARHLPWPDDRVQGPGIVPWADTDYAMALQTLADAMEMSLQRCAERFGTLSLPNSTQGWHSHPVLGFVRRI
ncbi:CRISPR-associated helicase Cas3 family [Sphaerotilus natans subsp. natans DSM 6575]|uniref:CRISPR-associated helicase Cas3 family n=1 Tax=Sphaerotilus natans subsp. natans DSM 6575 TaxID=1286631 RepID=A0A059KRY8_9BURK|nr:type I-F CRISPR-associated helicase Cas3f [Sphaerotilus natans]KDB54257.1 CRISPR-associated helicase Cas3 family [Sphaerotilus natans subsp. natans DSM 6575]SIR90113.1 CRISPR-associated helicase, Cas3 family [Sphaerotilus natans]